MKKIFKKLILLVSILSAIFMLSSSSYATLLSGSADDKFVPAETTTGDAPSSAGKVYFQIVDATNVKYIEVSGLKDRSIWASNRPAKSIKYGDGTGYLDSSMAWHNGGTFAGAKSRIIMTKIYKVNPSKRFTMVIANNGQEPADAKACVGQYDSSLRFLDDGNWKTSTEDTVFYNNATMTVSTTGQKVYNCTTQWIIPVLRYNNGDNTVGSGIEYTVGWGDFDLKLQNYHTYYVFDSFKYTKNLNGGGNTTVVDRWGIGNVSSSFTAPTRTGYTFKGWKITDSNGNVIKIIDENNNVLKTCDCVTVNELNTYDCLNGKKFYTNFFKDLTFTAQWTANTYTNTLNYNANGGSGAPASQSVNRTYPNTAYTHTVSTTVPTRTGYTFAGWYTAASGGTKVGTTYTVGSNNNAGNQSATLYAHWTANVVRLDYRANGGTINSSSYYLNAENQIVRRSDNNVYFQSGVYGTNIIPVTPASIGLSKKGYTFSHWRVHGTNKVMNAGTAYSSTLFTAWNNVNANVSNTSILSSVLWAEWTANNYTVTYNSNGGTGSMANSTATYDSNFLTRQNTFTRKGYTFAGWNEKADGTGVAWGLNGAGVYECGTPWKWTYTNNITLYAQWVPNTYTVTYNANGGTGTMSDSTIIYGNDFMTKQNAFTKPGYTFAGWNEKADGTGTAWKLTSPGVYECGTPWKWTYTNNITLYAQWTVNTYTVTYNANGGTGSMSDSSIVYGNDFMTKQNVFTKPGYTFAGWNEKADGTGTAWRLTSPGVYESGKTWPYTYNYNITLYAQWVDDTAPDITHTYKKGNCNTEQSFNITVKDNGSGIKAYTISGAGVTATNGSLTYSYTSGTVLNNVTVGVTVKDVGELKITATDISGNTASTSIVFVKTYLDNNQSRIAGPNRLATGNEFSSVAGATCHPYTLNTYGETVTPEKPERKGCDNGGWSVNDFVMSGSNSITTNGDTYYVVWKDTLAPKVTVRAEEVDNTEWKLTLDIYDAISTGASTYAGSDVAGYYIGGNSDYMKNTYYAVECNADGSATNVEVNVKPGEMPTIYINVADKAGNVSREGETVLEFKKVTLATRVTDSTSLAEFDYAGKKNLAVYTFYVLNGTRVDFPEARRIGYHGTSDPNKSDKSTTWTTGAKDDVIGAKYAVINKDVVYYPTFVPNVYEITYEVNTPKDNSTITTPEMKEFTATNDTGLNMQANLTNPVKGYITYEGKAIAAEYVNDSSIPVGEINKKPEELTAKGWKFLGWYDDKAYTVKYDLTKTGNDIYTSEAYRVYTEKCEADSSEYWNEYGWTNNSDTTLYAHWMVNKYIINYDMNAKDGDYCPNEGSKVEGKAVTAAGDNRQIALCDTKVKLSGREDAGNTMVKVAESKETNYLLGLEVGIITEKEYVTVGELQSWSTDANARALEDQNYISKQIGATGTGKDAKFTDIGINITDGEEVTVYAVWDHAPIFERKSVSLLSEKLNDFKDGDEFKYKEFSAYILSKVILIDPEDGMPETIETEDWKETTEVSIVEGMLSTALDTYVYTLDRKENGAIKLTFIDIEQAVSQLLTYTTNASCQIKVDIEDTYGNITRDEITIYFQSSIANEDIKTGVDESTLFTRTHYTRAINKYFFEQSLLDTTDWSNYRDLGALRPTSVWVNDPEYRELLSTTLNNLEEGKYIVSYHFTRDEVLATQMYTYGKATYDEIVERYSVAKAEAIKAMLKGKYTEEGHRITTINETGEGSVEEVLGAYNELFEEWGVIKR